MIWGYGNTHVFSFHIPKTQASRSSFFSPQSWRIDSAYFSLLSSEQNVDRRFWSKFSSLGFFCSHLYFFYSLSKEHVGKVGHEADCPLQLAAGVRNCLPQKRCTIRWWSIEVCRRYLVSQLCLLCVLCQLLVCCFVGVIILLSHRSLLLSILWLLLFRFLLPKLNNPGLNQCSQGNNPGPDKCRQEKTCPSWTSYPFWSSSWASLQAS